MYDGPPRLLTIDCASRFGWCFGVTGEKPQSGSRHFTRDGNPPKGGSISNGAKFYNAMRWAAWAAKEFQPTHVFCEAPIAPNAKQGQTSSSTMTVLYGLPACLQGVFYGLGVYSFDYAYPNSVRSHFIGKGNLPGEKAKPMVWRKCVALGWIDIHDEDISHDRSDACAIWSWAETRIAPKLAQPVDDLFLKANARACQ
jgi:hypothetical protein